MAMWLTDPQIGNRPIGLTLENDTGGALCPSQHCGRQLAALHIQGNRDAPHGCGSGKLGGIDQFFVPFIGIVRDIGVGGQQTSYLPDTKNFPQSSKNGIGHDHKHDSVINANLCRPWRIIRISDHFGLVEAFPDA